MSIHQGQPIAGPDGIAQKRDAFIPLPPNDTRTIAQWRKRLQQASPHSDQMSYLHLVWEPGWTWEPVGRWMLFDCFPVLATDPTWLDEYRKGDPSVHVKHDSITGMITQDALITGTQYRVYQETGRHSRPFWVIQGTNGGHKVFFSDAEKKLLKMRGYPDTMPAPGELPYAPFDNRVIDHIHRYDKLRRANGNAKRMAELSMGQEKDLLRKNRKELLGWLEEQIADVAAEMVFNLDQKDGLPDDLRTQGTITPTQRIVEQEGEWIETGRLADKRDGAVS